MKTYKKQRRCIAMCMFILLSLYGCLIPSQTAQAKEQLAQGADILYMSEMAKTSADMQDTNSDTANNTKENTGAQYTYDKLNRLTKVTYKDGSVVTYTYDKNGNLLESHVSAVPTKPPVVTHKPTETVTPTTKPTITEQPATTVTSAPVRTVTPTVTVAPIITNQAVVYYSNESWERANIHYQVGNGEWTSLPGMEMTRDSSQSGYEWKYVIELGTASEATVCFNDGNGNWDSRNEVNYKVYAGTYGIKNGEITKIITSDITPTVTQVPFQPGTVEVYYSNESWERANIHYQVGNGEWTSLPGVEMAKDGSQSGYQWKYVIDLKGASEAFVCFNNGNGSWDSQNESNYKVYEGQYGIKNGKVTKLNPDTGNTIEVYYGNTGWIPVYIHYQVGNGEWTDLPGIAMTKTTEKSGYQWKYVITMGNESSASVCFTDGNGNWDSKYQGNYLLTEPGVYGIKDGAINQLQ
ncbi:MAG: hypothetical protein K2M46_02945 [Lachnospiraceae bacterium]|nr:hypothetical protein [Lachnospiraceae bacterium]